MRLMNILRNFPMYNEPNQPQQQSSGDPPYGPPPPSYGSQQQSGYQQQGQYPPYGQPSGYQQPGGYPQYGQPQLQYVGVGLRFVALLIDTIIVGVVAGLLSVVFRDAPGISGTLTALI